jgi:hypothetical protein
MNRKQVIGQSFFLALLAAVAAWHELVLLTFR